MVRIHARQPFESPVARSWQAIRPGMAIFERIAALGRVECPEQAKRVEGCGELPIILQLDSFKVEKATRKLGKNKIVQHRVDSRSDVADIPPKTAPSPVHGPFLCLYSHLRGCALYVGSSLGLPKRLMAHGRMRGAKFTRDHPGGRLVYFEGPLPELAAVRRERQLKRWTRAKNWL
jgi:predicted GIY-YIG superfamily endonuclease